VLAKSQDRVKKERSMRQRRLRVYLKTLKNITQRKTLMKRDDLHQAIGAAKKEAGRAARFVKLTIEHHQRSTGQGKKAKRDEVASLSYELDRKKLREAWRREGRYLLSTNMSHEEPAKLWEYYLQLAPSHPPAQSGCALPVGSLSLACLRRSVHRGGASLQRDEARSRRPAHSSSARSPN
jgi:hypothetical protein